MLTKSKFVFEICVIYSLELNFLEGEVRTEILAFSRQYGHSMEFVSTKDCWLSNIRYSYEIKMGGKYPFHG